MRAMADAVNPPRGFNSGVVLAIIGLGLGCASLEALAVTLDPGQLSRQMYAPDAIIGYRLAPRPSDAPWPKVNEDGVRHGPVPPIDDTVELRILCLGDSMTGGGSMPPERAWPDQLQKRLEAETEQPVRAINGGIEGYGIHAMALLMEELAPKYQPDLVILMFQDPGHGIHVPARADQRWRYALYNVFLGSTFVRATVLAATGSNSFGSLPGLVAQELAHDPLAAAVRNLTLIAETARVLGSDILFVQAPPSPANLADGTLTTAPMREALDALPDPARVLWAADAPAFVAREAEAWGAEDAHHLSEAGNDALAEAIAVELHARGLVAGEPG